MQVFFFYRDSDTYIATSYDDPLYNAGRPDTTRRRNNVNIAKRKNVAKIINKGTLTVNQPVKIIDHN
jgi:hypothetical protein